MHNIQLLVYMWLQNISLGSPSLHMQTQAAALQRVRNARGVRGVISECLELELQGQHLPSGHQALISITDRWRGAAQRL